MKDYIKHIIAIVATFFGSHATMTPTTAIAQDPESQQWDAARSAGTVQALEDYLAQYPVGRFSREAFREIIRLSNNGIGEAPICDTIETLDPQMGDENCQPIMALY